MMRAINALIKREFLEHRGSFLYAPIVLLALFTIAVLFGATMGNIEPEAEMPRITGAVAYQVVVGGVFMAWTFYLLVGLFFYFSDSFSADRRNNALLFWKSMPQSDLKILSIKALTGITLFPALIAIFALMTGAIAYFVVIVLSTRVPFLAAPGFFEAISTWVQMSIAGAAMLILSVLWYAPFLAWVAGLSTLFQRWSIPLAFLIPGAIVLMEHLNNIGGTQGGRPIADYLAYRLQGPFGGQDEDMDVLLSDGAAWRMLSDMFTQTNWVQVGIGLVFTGAVIYLASEYRRRRIEA
jgi:ABC-2 type transport system permease protein